MQVHTHQPPWGLNVWKTQICDITNKIQVSLLPQFCYTILIWQSGLAGFIQDFIIIFLSLPNPKFCKRFLQLLKSSALYSMFSFFSSHVNMHATDLLYKMWITSNWIWTWTYLSRCFTVDQSRHPWLEKKESLTWIRAFPLWLKACLDLEKHRPNRRKKIIRYGSAFCNSRDGTIYAPI